MLRCCGIRSWVSVRCVGGVAAENDATSMQMKRAYGFVDSLRIRDILKPNSAQAKKLLSLIESFQSGHEMRKLRNKMKRKFGQQYHLIFPSLRSLCNDTLKLEMSMYRNLGARQYDAFSKCLVETVEREDLSYDNKRQRLYEIISFQHDMFPGAAKRAAINLPDKVHRWFWCNIPREESFEHFYFLIKNDIFLSSPKHAWKFSQLMMQGSQLELQLSTFQLFLHQEAHRSMFYQKFGKLYSFDSMEHILNRVFRSRDLRFAKYYLSAFLNKMEIQGAHEGSLFRFNNALLYYLSQTEDTETFLWALAVELQLIKTIDEPRNFLKMLHRPLVFLLKMLRRQGFHQEFFLIISLIPKLPLGDSHIFRQQVFTELISLLKSFNDPKLTCQYVMSGFSRHATGSLLNDLGIWSSAFHGNTALLPQEELESQINSFEMLLPPSMSVHGKPSMAILTELYRIVLSTNSKIMPNEQYRDLLVDLYYKYNAALRNRRFDYSNHDTGILNVILHHTRFELRDPKLAYVLLHDFYSRGLGKVIRVTSTKCPFSLVVYQNEEISQPEISQLLTLMHENNISLHFQFCTAMVLRYLKLNNTQDAHAWYKKILHGGFKVEHMLLIKAINDNGWEYPASFDRTFLEKLDDYPNTTDDALFLEESSELADVTPTLQTHQPSLQHVVDLLKTL